MEPITVQFILVAVMAFIVGFAVGYKRGRQNMLNIARSKSTRIK